MLHHTNRHGLTAVVVLSVLFAAAARSHGPDVPKEHPAVGAGKGEEPEKASRTTESVPTEVAARADELQASITSLRHQARYAQGASVAKDLIDVQCRQGANPSVACADAQLLSRTLKTLAELPENAQQELAECEQVFDTEWEQWVGSENPRLREATEALLSLRLRLLGEEHPEVARSRGDLAVALYYAGSHEEAERQSKEALRVNRKTLGQKHPIVARELNLLGLLARQRGDVDKATDLLREALAIRREVLGPNHPKTAQSLDNLAGVLGDSGQYAKAEKLVREALRIRRESLGEDHAHTSDSLHLLGHYLIQMGRYTEAEAVTRKAYEVRQRVYGDDNVYTLWSLNNLGAILSDQGHYREAEAVFREVCEARVKMYGDHHADVAHCRTNIAYVLKEQGKLDEAEVIYRDLLATDEKNLGDDNVMTAKRRADMACILWDQGAYAESQRHAEAALALRERLLDENDPAVADSKVMIALLKRRQGHFGESERLIREALEIDRRRYGDRHRRVAHRLHMLAWTYLAKGDYASADPLFHEALELYVSLLGEDHPAVAELLYLYGPMLQEIGEYDAAAVALRRALRIRRKVFGETHWCVAEDMQRLGRALGAAGHYEEAEGLLRQADSRLRRLIKPDHPDIAGCLHDLGRVLQASGQRDEAERCYRNALERRRQALSENSPLVAESMLALGDLLATNERSDDGTEAELLLDKAVKIFRATHDPGLHFACTRRARLLSQDPDRREAAMALLEVAITEIEHRRGMVPGDAVARARFLSELIQSDPFGLMARVLLQTGRANAAESAFQYVERGRGRALLDLLDRAGFDLRQSMSADAVHDQMASDGLVPRTTPELARALGPDDLLMLYDIGGEDGLLWLLASDGTTTTYPLAGPDGAAWSATSLSTAIHDALSEWSRGTAGRRTAGKASAGLYDALIPSSCRNRVLGARRLYIVPDGPLHELPFEALVVDGPTGRRFVDVAPPIVYGPSATVLQLCKQRAARRQRREPGLALVALGDPAYAATATGDEPKQPPGTLLATLTRELSREYAPLPGTRAEVQTVSAVVRENPDPLFQGIQILTGRDANRERLFRAADRPRMLHLATHGISVSVRRAFETALVLAPSPSDAGVGFQFLTLRDVLRDWRGKLDGTQLVVLSACHSAGGPLEASDGLVALTWGFLYAGAESVVASQWNVSDLSTAILMGEFYGNLLEHRMSRSEALRQAKRSIRGMTRAEIEERIEALGLSATTAAERNRAGAVRHQQPTDRPYADPYYWAPFVLIGAD